jgi:hypothetical protein
MKNWLMVTQERANYQSAVLDSLEDATLLGNGAFKISYEPTIESRPRIVMKPRYEPAQMQQLATNGMPQQQLYAPSVEAGPEERWRIRAEYCPLWHIYPDPYTANFYDSWSVEEYEIDHHTLMNRVATKMYREMPDLGDGVRLQRSEFLSRWQRYELSETRTSNRKRHLVTEMTGDITSPDGTLIAKDYVVTIIDEKIIARIGPNPRWHGENPICWVDLLPYPGRVWGRSLMESAAEMQEEESYLFNLMLDDAKYSVMSAFMLDDTKMLEPMQDTSIEPGKIYRGMEQFLTKVDFRSNLQAVWPVIGFMDQQVAKTTFVSENVDGQPTSRGRPSAKEIGTKTAQSIQHFQNMARLVEDGPMTRGLQLMLNLMLQFGDETGDPRLSKITEALGGPQMLNDQVQRFMLLDVPYKLQVRGLTTMVDREQVVEKYMQAIQMLQSLQIAPTDLVKPAYNLITLMGLSPEQMGLPVEPEEYRAMQQRMMQQQAMNPQGGPPGPRPGGGPPGASPGGPQGGSPGGEAPPQGPPTQ